jgi:hypothetical protein
MKNKHTPFVFLNTLLGYLYVLLLISFIKDGSVLSRDTELFYLGSILLLIFPFYTLIKDISFCIFKTKFAVGLSRRNVNTLLILLLGFSLVLVLSFLPKTFIPIIICIFWIYAISSLKSYKSGNIAKLLMFDFKGILKSLSPFHKIE